VADTGPTIFGKIHHHQGRSDPRYHPVGLDTFDGEGSSSQGNSLVGSLTVTVIEVQANGNLVVQGDKT
jgi:flagellar basal body L-ring protein FlgH